MRLFAYKMTNDSGCAPNPFFGALTLAICKPQIRRAKEAGDWIAGFTSKSMCGDEVGEERLIYLMQVERKLSFAEYFVAPEFRKKIPDLNRKEPVHWRGDNIYKLKGKAYVQVYRTGDAEVESEIRYNPEDGTVEKPRPPKCAPKAQPRHAPDDLKEELCHMEDHMAHDLSGQSVLIAGEFYYFGGKPLKLPPEFRPDIPPGQSAHGSRTDDSERASAFVEYIRKNYEAGKLYNAPYTWPEGDASWQTQE